MLQAAQARLVALHAEGEAIRAQMPDTNEEAEGAQEKAMWRMLAFFKEEDPDVGTTEESLRAEIAKLKADNLSLQYQVNSNEQAKVRYEVEQMVAAAALAELQKQSAARAKKIMADLKKKDEEEHLKEGKAKAEEAAKEAMQSRKRRKWKDD